MTSEQAERGPDLREYWSILVRGRWFLLATFVLVVGSTAFFSFTADPVYEASAEILVEKSRFTSNIADLLTPLIPGSGKDLQNRIEILQSRPVLERAFQRLQADP